jgi:hypothetical protein
MPFPLNESLSPEKRQQVERELAELTSKILISSQGLRVFDSLFLPKKSARYPESSAASGTFHW